MTRLLTWFKRLLIAAAVVLIGFVALAPNKDTYTSNADAPMVTRTLVPRETTTTGKPFTTTTVGRSSSATSAEATLDMVTADGMMVAGMHLDFPGFGYVEKAGEGFHFTAAPYDYRA